LCIFVDVTVPVMTRRMPRPSLPVVVVVSVATVYSLPFLALAFGAFFSLAGALAFAFAR
jgi:hypothetical protein